MKIKRVAIAAFASGIICWIILAYAPTYKLLYASNISLGVCFAAAGMTTVIAFIRNWSIAHRDLITGIITAGTGLCCTIAPPL